MISIRDVAEAFGVPESTIREGIRKTGCPTCKGTQRYLPKESVDAIYAWLISDDAVASIEVSQEQKDGWVDSFGRP